MNTIPKTGLFGALTEAASRIMEKTAPRLSALEVRCERMSPNDFFEAIQSAEWRAAHVYSPDDDPRYDWVKKVTGLKHIR